MQANKKNYRVSRQQLETLCNFLSNNRRLAISHNRSNEAKEYSKTKWKEITDILNTQGPPKDWRAWSKYWIDYKGKLKAKDARIRLSDIQNVGGPPVLELSAVQIKFLKILNSEFSENLPFVLVDPKPEHPVVGEIRDIQMPVNILDNSTAPTLTPTVSQSMEGVTPSTSNRVENRTSVPRSLRRRRFRRLERPLGFETTIRGIMRSSQQLSDASVKVAKFLKEIVDLMKHFKNMADRMERYEIKTQSKDMYVV